MWIAISNSLPTCLLKRKLANSRMCKLCGEYSETMKHLLLLYPQTRVVWFGGPLGYRLINGYIPKLDIQFLDLLKGYRWVSSHMGCSFIVFFLLLLAFNFFFLVPLCFGWVVLLSLVLGLFLLFFCFLFNESIF